MRILAVEDDPSLRRAVAAILSKNNMVCDAADSAEEALLFLASNHYDGMILDVMLPGMNGIALLQKLRGQGNGLPILILSAKSEVEDKVLGLDTGANDYLTKPFAVTELLARVRAMTRTPEQASSNLLRTGNMTLDCARFELRAPKGVCALSGKEFLVMEMLMRNKNQMLGTAQIMERVWGLDSDADIGVVWAYISFLRKKMAAVGADAELRSKRGVGYMLAVKEC